MRKFLTTLTLAVFIVGCATSVEQYKAMNESLQKGQHKKVVQLLKKARKEKKYEKKDRVLYSIEMGLAKHYAGQYSGSNKRFARADQYIDDLFTKSLSNMGFSIMTNNTELPYRGEPYDDVYINIFKALNYAQLNDPDAVFVEVRKLDNKLEKMEERLKQVAEDYKKSSASKLGDKIDIGKDEQTSFEIGDLSFHTSALGRYMSYIMYLSQRDASDARIDREKIEEAFANQPNLYNFDIPDLPKGVDVERGKARVNTVALLGRGPIKYEESQRMTYKGYYVKWAYPEMKTRGTQIDRVVVEPQGQSSMSLGKLEDINRVAKSVFEAKEPLIKTQNFMRALGKAILAKEASEEAGGGVLGAVGKVAAQEFTENADLRTVRLYPGEVHVGHFTVPDGEKVTLNVKYYSDGNVVDKKTIKKTFHRGEPNFVRLQKFI
ncbi:MAG: hypothetical protein ABEJ65_09770 [bacterium]